MALRKAAIVAAILIASTTVAVAKPRHRHHSKHQAQAEIVCNHLGCNDRGNPGYSGGGYGSDLVSRARADLGKTAAQLGLRRTRWCSAFLRLLTGQSGVDDRAVSWLRRPHTRPHIGAIAVVRNGHHVGVVSGFDANGNPILISGNHNHQVGEGVYPRRTVLAYVEP